MGKKLAAAMECILAGLLLAVALPGCSENGPSTYPVHGKLVFEGEGDVFKLHNSQGGILFESSDQPGVQAYGDINADGTFKLTTSINGAAKDGAIAGKHRGRLVLDEEVQKLVAAQFLDLEKSGITVAVPTESEVVIKIWP